MEKDFKAVAKKNGAEYNYFLPEKINHSYVCTDEIINEIVSEQQNKKIKISTSANAERRYNQAHWPY